MENEMEKQQETIITMTSINRPAIMRQLRISTERQK